MLKGSKFAMGNSCTLRLPCPKRNIKRTSLVQAEQSKNPKQQNHIGDAKWKKKEDSEMVNICQSGGCLLCTKEPNHHMIVKSPYNNACNNVLDNVHKCAREESWGHLPPPPSLMTSDGHRFSKFLLF